MVVYPFATNDQLGTAARVAKFDLGIVGSRSSDSIRVISNRIEQILNDETLQKRVIHMQNHLARYDNENSIAEAVNRLIKKGKKVPN